MEKVTREIIVVVVTGTILLLIFTLLILMVLINYQRRKRKLLYEKKELESRFHQELLMAQLEMQEHVLTRVSQEIHDNVGQILSLVKVNLNILNIERDRDPRVAEVSKLVGNAISELRDISLGYFADKLTEDGLVSAIRKELQQLERTGLIKTSFHTDKEWVLIDKHKSIFLYRMFQEICNNIIKHAEAKRVEVSIIHYEQQVRIRIIDDGIGFNELDQEFRPGMGLNIIRQRAEMIGASVIIKSSLGRGTIIELTIKEEQDDKSSIS